MIAQSYSYSFEIAVTEVPWQPSFYNSETEFTILKAPDAGPMQSYSALLCIHSVAVVPMTSLKAAPNVL